MVKIFHSAIVLLVINKIRKISQKDLHSYCKEVNWHFHVIICNGILNLRLGLVSFRGQIDDAILPYHFELFVGPVYLLKVLLRPVLFPFSFLFPSSPGS